MKLFLNSLLYLLVSFLYQNNAYSLSERQMNQICRNKQRKVYCLKNLKSKNINLLKGNRIEIPVIPFKK